MTRTRKKSSTTDSTQKTTKPANTKTIESEKEGVGVQESASTDQPTQPEVEVAVVDAVIVTQEPKKEIQPLTESERTRFQKLEDETLIALQELQHSLLRAAQSLREIRDDELFREDYPTFEAYCKQKLGFSKRFINYQINYAKIFDNFQQREQDVPVLPTNESQVRPLAGLKPEEQPKVWSKAVEVANGNVPSREIVARVVQTYRAEQRAQQGKKGKKGKKRTIDVVDCIRIKGIPTTELSAYKNWWGFVKDIADENYDIELPHTTIPGVKASNIALETAGDTSLNKKQTEARRSLFEKLTEIYRLKTETVEDEQLLEYLLLYFVTLTPRKQVNKQGKTTWSVTLTSFEKKALELIEREVKKP